MYEENYIESNQQENEKEMLNEHRKYAFLKVFKNLKKIDYVIIGAVVLLLFFAVFAKLNFVKVGKTPVQAEKQVEIQVFFRNLIVSNEKVPFQVDDEAFITIRNVPYTSLKILEVNYDRKKMAVPSTRRKSGYVVIDDVTQPLQFDFLVTLEDKVKVTNEGEYVVGGNKLKIGLPIILEGKDYRFNGVISSIKPVDENPATDNTEKEGIEK